MDDEQETIWYCVFAYLTDSDLKECKLVSHRFNIRIKYLVQDESFNKLRVEGRLDITYRLSLFQISWIELYNHDQHPSISALSLGVEKCDIRYLDLAEKLGISICRYTDGLICKAVTKKNIVIIKWLWDRVVPIYNRFEDLDNAVAIVSGACKCKDIGILEFVLPTMYKIIMAGNSVRSGCVISLLDSDDMKPHLKIIFSYWKEYITNNIQDIYQRFMQVKLYGLICTLWNATGTRFEIKANQIMATMNPKLIKLYLDHPETKLDDLNTLKKPYTFIQLHWKHTVTPVYIDSDPDSHETGLISITGKEICNKAISTLVNHPKQTINNHIISRWLDPIWNDIRQRFMAYLITNNLVPLEKDILSNINYVEYIKTIIRNNPGIDLSLFDDCFHENLYYGNTNVVMYLMDIGIDPSTDDSKALDSACRQGLTDIVIRLLTDNRINPTARQSSSLYESTRCMRKDVTQILLNDHRVCPNTLRFYDKDTSLILLRDPRVIREDKLREDLHFIATFYWTESFSRTVDEYYNSDCKNESGISWYRKYALVYRYIHILLPLAIMIVIVVVSY